MAYIPDDQKQKQQQDGTDPSNPSGIPQAGDSSAAGSAFAGSGGTGSAGPVSGVPGWTNIQSYLDANKGQSKTADLVKQDVGSTIDTEKQNASADQATARGQGQAEIDRTNIGQDQASKLLQQASQNYSYAPKGSQAQSEGAPDPYGEATGKLKGALNPYAGPTGYAYGTGAGFQQAGSNLGSDQGWNSILNQLYDKNAFGGAMGAGSRALQTQLDAADPAMGTARQDLTTQYKGANDDIQKGITDTDSFLKNASSQAGASQDSLRSYLGGQATNDRDTLGHKADIWNQSLKDFASQVMKGRNQSLGDQGVDTITPGMQYDMSNVGGVDSNRNEFNTIQDILGRSEQAIGRADQFVDPSQTRFHISDPSVTPQGTGPIKSDMTAQEMGDNNVLKYFVTPEMLAAIQGQGGPLAGVSEDQVKRRL